MPKSHDNTNMHSFFLQVCIISSFIIIIFILFILFSVIIGFFVFM